MTRRALKIGVAGTHSTGKSTLLTELNRVLTADGLRVATVGNLAIGARSAGFPILMDQTEETALWIVSEGIRRETEAGLDRDVVLIDRPVFDAIGYLEAALEISGRAADTARLEMLRAMARTYSREYDIVVVTRLDDSLPLGAGRDTDEAFRRGAGEKILAFAGGLDREVLAMTSANADEIARTVVASVRGLRSPGQ